MLGCQISELHRPWIHEDHLDIEDYEQHRHQIEFHRKSRGAFPNRQHPTLIRAILRLIRLGGAAEDDARAQDRHGEADGNEDLKKDGKVIDWHDSRRLRGCFKGSDLERGEKTAEKNPRP